MSPKVQKIAKSGHTGSEFSLHTIAFKDCALIRIVAAKVTTLGPLLLANLQHKITLQASLLSPLSG